MGVRLQALLPVFDERGSPTTASFDGTRVDALAQERIEVIERLAAPRIEKRLHELENGPRADRLAQGDDAVGLRARDGGRPRGLGFQERAPGASLRGGRRRRRGRRLGKLRVRTPCEEREKQGGEEDPSLLPSL